MTDVNTLEVPGNEPAPVAPATPAPAEPVTPEPEPSSTPAPVTPAPAEPVTPEPTTPKTVDAKEHENVKEALKQERIKSRALRRGRRSRREVPAATPDNQDVYMKQLETKVALSELKDGARKLVKDYPELPKHVKRAILRNPRGFINANTQDVPNGLNDIEDYIESEMEHVEPAKPVTPEPKEVPVAGTNTPATSQGATPAQVQAILDTPVDEWTKADRKTLDDYKASQA